MLSLLNESVTVGPEWGTFTATCRDTDPANAGNPLTLAQVYVFKSGVTTGLLYVGQWNMSVLIGIPYALSFGLQRATLGPGSFQAIILVRDASNRLSVISEAFLPFLVPNSTPQPRGSDALQAPVFTQAYHGAKTGNANRRWGWKPGLGPVPTSYRVRLVRQPGTIVLDAPVDDTEFLHREHFQNYRWPKPGWMPQPQGEYIFSVTAVKDFKKGPPAVDPFTISYFLDPAITDMGQQDMGLSAVNVFFPPGQEIKDAVALRYKFQVVENEGAGRGGKIVFGACRLADATGQRRPYALQQNFYTSRAEYSDPVCDAAFPLFDSFRQEACLVLALSDLDNTGQIGAKTYDPVMLPRYFSLVDGRVELPNITLRLQQNMNGKVGEVYVSRGEIISDKDGWKCVAGRLLDAETYREWRNSVSVDGRLYLAGMAVPDRVAQYLSFFNMLNFSWEFPLQPGYFTVHIWDVQVQREGRDWQPLTQWQVDRHVGYPTDFGFRAVTLADGRRVLEASNVAPIQYMPAGNVFTV